MTRPAVEGEGQNFSRWYTDWPSTHRLAGQSVEVVPVAVAERLAEALKEALDMLDDAKPVYGDPALRRSWGRRRKDLRAEFEGGSA